MEHPFPPVKPPKHARKSPPRRTLGGLVGVVVRPPGGGTPTAANPDSRARHLLGG